MAQQRRGGRRRRKVDFIAANHIEYIDYKDTDLLKRFISERGKILPRRVTGTSAISTGTPFRPETEWTISRSPAPMGTESRISNAYSGLRSSTVVAVTGTVSSVSPLAMMGFMMTSPPVR